jgi:hypothetical protein
MGLKSAARCEFNPPSPQIPDAPAAFLESCSGYREHIKVQSEGKEAANAA